MKKTIAGIGAAVLGLTGVAVATAPAEAATPGCGSIADHNVSAGTTQADADWYMDCVPQYGVGKAEFTVTSDTEFSSDFDLSSSDYAVATSSLPAGAADYTESEPIGGFTSLSKGGAEANSQSYTGDAILPIVSVAKVSTTALPTDCNVDGATYQAAYKVTYGSATTTFTTTDAAGQSIDGHPGVFSVIATAPALLLGLNFSDGAIDPDAPFCATNPNGASSQLATASSDTLEVSAQATNGPFGTMSPVGTSPNVLDLGTSALQSGVVPTITSTSLPAATVGTAYSAALTATSTTPVTWSTSGSLPAGLSINPSTGVISGTPTAAGTQAFAVTATNVAGSSSANFTIATSAAPKVATGTAASLTALTTKGATYGKTASATVVVSTPSGAASGFVSFAVDGKPGATTALANGTITAPLTGLKPGKHTVTVSYPGTPAVAASSAAASITIAKGVSKATVTLNHKSAVKGKTKLKATLKVTVPGTSVTASGKVRVLVNGKTVKTVTLKKGKASATLPTFKKTGKLKVTAQFVGTTLLASDKTATTKVTVRK